MTLFEQCTKRRESDHALYRDTLSPCQPKMRPKNMPQATERRKFSPTPRFCSLFFSVAAYAYMREKKRKSAADYYCDDHRSGGGGGGDTGNGYDEREARIFIAVRTTRFAIFCGGRRENTKI